MEADIPVTPGSDAEILQFVRKLETKQKEQTLTSAEQLALTLLYVWLQQDKDAVAVLDSMELSTPADLQVREWIIARLVMKQAKPDAALTQRGSEAVNRLQNFHLSERDLLNLVPILQHFSDSSTEPTVVPPDAAQQLWDHLSATVSDRRLLTELFYKVINMPGEPQQENAAKIAQRILTNPAFFQNSRRITTDLLLFQSAIKTLRERDRLETVVPVIETRLRGLRDKTDSRIFLARLYLELDRNDEAKALALELAQNPTAEPERRQMIVSLLLSFGLQRELEAMNRLLLERNKN